MWSNTGDDNAVPFEGELFCLNMSEGAGEKKNRWSDTNSAL